MNEPRSLTLYCANGCGRKAAAHGQVQVRTDGEILVTSRLVCLQCLELEREARP